MCKATELRQQRHRNNSQKSPDPMEAMWEEQLKNTMLQLSETLAESDRQKKEIDYLRIKNQVRSTLLWRWQRLASDGISVSATVQRGAPRGWAGAQRL